MIFYWGLWVIFLLLALTWQDNKNNLNYGILYLALFILAIITGGREYVGADWELYRTYYVTGVAYDKPNGHQELLFELIRNVCFNLGFSYWAFCFLISLISLSVLWKAMKVMGVKNCYLSFLVYLSLFFCNYQFNIIRHGTMASFILLAFAYKARGMTVKSLISISLGCCFHTLGFLFFPVLFIIDLKLSKKLYLSIAFFSLMALFLKVSQRIIELFPFLVLIDARVDSYVDPDRYGSYGLSIGVIANILIALCVLFVFYKKYCEDKTLRIPLNMLLFAFTISCIFNEFAAIVQRLANLLNMAHIFVIPFLLYIVGKKNLLIYSVFIVYLMLYYPISFTKENEMIGDNPMLPFKTDITNLFK